MHVASKHLHFSALAGLLTIAGLTIGFANAASEPLPSYVLSFVQISPNTVQDGSPFSGAKFDIAGYVNSPCYQIAGNEADMCSYQYGITQPLKMFIENGQLLSYLNTQGLLAQGFVIPGTSVAPVTATPSTTTNTPAVTETPAVQTPAVETTPDESMMTQSEREEFYTNLHQERSDRLWAVCDERYKTRWDKVDCYQRNMRMFMRSDVLPSEETVY